MFAAGDSLTGGDIHRTRAYRLRIVSQRYSVVLARKESASVAHVLQNIAVGIVVPYSFAASMVEVAHKAIPSTYRGSI